MKRPRIVARLVDLRAGEGPMAILSFLALLLTSAGYTALETARDALLVTRLPQRNFGIAYLSVAVCALPAATLLAWVSRRWDPRRVLVSLLLLGAAAPLGFAELPMGRPVVVGFYVTVALVSTAVFPQFWVLVGTTLTVGQSRRLIGPIAAAGVLGGVLGASLAAAAVPWLPVRGTIAVASALLALAAGAAFLVPSARRAPVPAGETSPPLATSMSAFREEPFLIRVAVLVAATTATALVIDYFFKSTIARTIPSAGRGAFIARYYAVVNVIALVVQLFAGSAILRGLGVATAMVVTPLLSVFGGAAALVAGSLALPVFVLKGADGSLRSSINRLTTELVYLPVSSSGRQRAKPFIDGAIVRVVQAITAGALFGAGAYHMLTPRVFSAAVIVLSLAWLVSAMTMRRHYLGQLRRSVVPAADDPGSLELDLPSAELVVEHLGSDDPDVVIGAMNTLARRDRQRLIPSLVLRHPSGPVLRRALEIFGAGPSTRTDWQSLASVLLGHPDDAVRIAAASALAAQGKLEIDRLAADPSPAVRGYAALHTALAGPHEDLLEDPVIAAALADEGPTVTGLLVAVADADPSPRVSRVLVALADLPHAPYSAAWAELLARATMRHGEVAMIPRLLEDLTRWEGRESLRGALVALGVPAFERIAEALEDITLPRRLRIQLPQSLGRFGTPAAAEKLLERVEHELDGLVRYKALRALGRLVADYRLNVDRARVERLVRSNLTTYFSLLGTRVALGTLPPSASREHASTFRLLSGLIDDKVRQALERAFRILKIAHPKEDIHRVYLAMIGPDKRARANAAEFLDALLRRRTEQELRDLVRLVCDDLSPRAQVERAASFLRLAPPRTHEQGVQAALADADIKVAALAALYAVATGNEHLVASVEKAREERPTLGLAALGVFHDPLPAR